MTICRELTVVKIGVDHVSLHPLKCRCWHCDYCAPMRASQLRRLAYLGRPDTFLTLTVNPKIGKGPDDRARLLAHAWRSLRAKIIYQHNKKQSPLCRLHADGKLPFIAVFEKTKVGEPHLHILARSVWLDQKWLSEQMNKIIKSPIVDVRRVSGKKAAAAYVAKYIGKDPTAFQGCKRYWRSQNYVTPEEWNADDPDAPKAEFLLSRKGVNECVHLLTRNMMYEAGGTDDARIIKHFDVEHHPPWRRLLELSGVIE